MRDDIEVDRMPAISQKKTEHRKDRVTPPAPPPYLRRRKTTPQSRHPPPRPPTQRPSVHTCRPRPAQSRPGRRGATAARKRATGYPTAAPPDRWTPTCPRSATAARERAPAPPARQRAATAALPPARRRATATTTPRPPAQPPARRSGEDGVRKQSLAPLRRDMFVTRAVAAWHRYRGWSQAKMNVHTYHWLGP